MNRSSAPHADGSFDRRRWMKLCASLGAAGLAGCLGGGDDSSSSGGSSGDAEPGDGDGPAPDDDATGSQSDDRDPAEMTSADGWGDPHDGVEVPDEPGTAILTIGGERVELSGSGHAAEDPDGAGTTGADLFEASGGFLGGEYRDTEVQLQFSRLVGYDDVTGTVAESDSLTLTRSTDGIRLGTVLYRLYDDGSLADDDSSGELAGRRFVDDSFVRVSQDGIVTAVETIDSHEDDSLGAFELGVRFGDGWEGLPWE